MIGRRYVLFDEATMGRLKVPSKRIIADESDNSREFFVPDSSDSDVILQPENLDLPPISTAPEVLEDEVRRSVRSTFSVRLNAAVLMLLPQNLLLVIPSRGMRRWGLI